MSEPDDPETGDVSGDLGAVVASFLILLASIVMTFVMYYILAGFS